MTFKKLEKLTDGKSLPIMGENEDGETFYIGKGEQDGNRFFVVSTAQWNGWMRHNTYWEDGTIEEAYER